MALKLKIIAVTVTTAGTRVRVVSSATDANRFARSAYFRCPTANTGAVFVGDSTVSSTVYTERLMPTEEPRSLGWCGSPRKSDLGDQRNYIDLYETYIDAEVNGEKCLVSIEIDS